MNDNNVHVIHQDGGVLLTAQQYADAHGKHLRTVQRWLRDSELPGAVQDDTGQWRIPATTRRVVGGTGQQLTRRTTSYDVVPAVPAAPVPSDPLDQLRGALVPLDVVADALGTTVGGVERMGDDGLLTIGPWGPFRARRAWLPPRS